MRQRPDEEFDLHQIEQVLQDCVDIIRETAEAGRASSSATLENTITAFVACALVSMTSTSTLQGSRRTIDDEESKAVPSAFPARTACAKRQTPMFGSDDEERREKRLVRSLPQPTSAMTRIDLKSDPRVFAVVDDRCNRTCHTPALIDHMRAVLESEGKELSPPVGEARHYTGIGGCRATGRRSIPFGLALPDGSSVRAVLMSNELSIGTERIMLLSIKAQATLGLVKDTRAGTCFLKDYGQFAPLYEVVGSDLRCVCISDWQADRPDAKAVLGPDESENLGMNTETMKCESSKSMREERVEAQPVQSDGQTDASAITNEMIQDYRRRLFRIYLQHAPEHIGKIPDLLQEHGSTKASLDALVARVLWEHLAKGSGECPTGIQMQPTLETSSDSVGSSKGIDTEVGRAEADKERVVCEMGKEIGLTFERKSVVGEPHYSDNYLEWISSQKWKSYDTYDSRGRQVRHTHGSREHNRMPTAGRQPIFANDLDSGRYVKTWPLSLNCRRWTRAEWRGQ